MRLGIISPFLVKCGISTYCLYLSEALMKIGVDVTVLAEEPFPDESALTKDIHTDVPYLYCWKRTEFYSNLIKEAQKYDIFHCQHQFGFFNNTNAWIELLHQIKIPKILTIHDIVPPCEQLYEYFTKTFELSDKLIVHTPTCYEMLLRWNCPKEKIAQIPHGTKLIDVPSKGSARETLGLPKDAKIILSWGFIWESKGILEMLEILKEIKKTYPEAIFIHAGGIHPILQKSQYLGKILKTAVQLGLTPKDLIITNWLPEESVPTYFGCADLIVLNYMRGSASASGAAHRAMASHRPIVGTDDPTLEDIPKYSVPRFSPSELYQAILKVLGDSNLQKELVKQGEEASFKTSWANIALQHKKLYEQV